MILHEFVHLITEPRRFEPPVAMSEALSIAAIYLGRENVQCLSVGEPEVVRDFELVEQHQLGPQRLADALFAATLLLAGVQSLLTCNARDYAPFEGLECIDPRVR